MDIPSEPRGIPTRLHTWGILRFRDGTIEQNPVGVSPDLPEAMRRVDRELRAADADGITALGLICLIPVNEPIELWHEPPRLVWVGHLAEIAPGLRAVTWVRET